VSRCETRTGRARSIVVSGTTWMILNRSQDRVLHRTGSTLDAFRTARRRVGSTARLERAGRFGVAVVGKTDTINLVRLATIRVDPVATADNIDEPVQAAVPMDEPVQAAVPIDEPVQAAVPMDEPVRVAIPVHVGPIPELVRLPGGASFTWIPADAPWPLAEALMGRGAAR
jgi:hypothetical protein